MTKVEVWEDPADDDGGAYLVSSMGVMKVEGFECDCCDQQWSMSDRFVVWHQPWHGGYWGEIMWTGPCCAEKVGAEHASLGPPDVRK